MNIKAVSLLQNYKTFKSVVQNNEKYKYIAEKRAYIDAKTSVFEDLAIATFLCAAISGVFGRNTVIKDKKINKIAIGFLVASVATLAIKWIKQIQLSKEYDREVRNDSKNFTGN